MVFILIVFAQTLKFDEISINEVIAGLMFIYSAIFFSLVTNVIYGFFFFILTGFAGQNSVQDQQLLSILGFLWMSAWFFKLSLSNSEDIRKYPYMVYPLLLLIGFSVFVAKTSFWPILAIPVLIFLWSNFMTFASYGFSVFYIYTLLVFNSEKLGIVDSNIVFALISSTITMIIAYLLKRFVNWIDLALITAGMLILSLIIELLTFKLRFFIWGVIIPAILIPIYLLRIKKKIDNNTFK
jgi:hypothetical protein